MRKSRYGKSGKGKRVLLAGQYGLLPQGMLYFELVLHTRYEDVLPSDEAAVEAALIEAREGQEELFVLRKDDTSGQGPETLDEVSEVPEVPTVAWEDTEPPAPERR